MELKMLCASTLVINKKLEKNPKVKNNHETLHLSWHVYTIEHGSFDGSNLC